MARNPKPIRKQMGKPALEKELQTTLRQLRDLPPLNENDAPIFETISRSGTRPFTVFATQGPANKPPLK